jgi:hypothetical protein
MPDEKRRRTRVQRLSPLILKDTVNRIGDLLDDGQPNQSFKA